MLSVFKNKNIYFFLFNLIIYFIFFMIFNIIYNLSCNSSLYTDLCLHLEMGIDEIEKKIIPVTFLYSRTIYLFTGFSLVFDHWLLCAKILIPFFISLKFIFTNLFFKEYGLKGVFVSFILLFLSAIAIDHSYYINYYPITIWHNSTSLVVLPFVILIFYLHIKYLDKNINNKEFIFIVNIISIFMILVKPNFVFCYIPFSLLNFFYFRDKTFLINFFTLFIILFLQTILFYNGASKGGVALEFFYSPFSFGDCFFISFAKKILSLAFPLSLLALYGKIYLSDRNVFLSILLFFISLIIRYSFVETGPRKFSGNFFWQIHMCNYLVFLTSSAFYLKNFENANKMKKLIPLIFFFIHFIFGLFYINNILLGRGYF